jgi:hypothetical protein
MKTSPAAGSEAFKRLWLPNFPRESCSNHCIET